MRFNSMAAVVMTAAISLFGQNSWKPTIFDAARPKTDTTGVKVSVSQQGAEVLKANGGKVIKGIGIGSVDVCNMSASDARGLDVGTIYAAIRSMEVSTLGMSEATLVLDRAVSTSKEQVILDIGTGVSAAGALGANIGKTSSGWRIGLTALPVVITSVNVFVMRRLPSDAATKQYLLRSTGSKPDWVLPPGACIPDGRVFLFRYHGDWNPQEVILQ
jgi:hypothetical protein